MVNDGSPPSSRAGAGAGRRCCTRCDLLTLALAVMLCSATYGFSIWRHGRTLADKIVIGPTPVVVVGATLCADVDELDFETHHSAEKAGLSVSNKTTATINSRRALRSVARVDTVHRSGVARAGSLAHGAEAAAGRR